MKTLLGFADAHVSPGQNLDRFDWLGRMIADLRPDAVWNGGDLATCDSVSYWPVPFQEMTTLKDEVDVVIEAQRRLWAPLEELNERRRASKHGPVQVRRLCTLGNHEERLNRRISDQERGIGSVIDPIKLFGFDEYWDDIAEYKEYLVYEGLYLTHVPINGMGKPMDGVYRGRNIALQSAGPVLYCHTHKMDFTSVPIMGGNNQRRQSLNLPCFMEQDHVENYAKKSATGWDYGVVVLDIFEPGKFTFRWISMAELKAQYGEDK